MSALKGNKCLLYLQKLSNYALLSVSFSFLALGIYLAYTTRTIGVFQITFISLGALELLSAILALTKHNSKGFLSCYIHIMLVLVVVQALASGLAFLYKDMIVLWAEEASSMEAKIVKRFHGILVRNVNITVYLAISASTIQVLSLAITACYKATLKKQNGDLYSRLLANKRKDKEDPYQNITDKDAQEWLESMNSYSQSTKVNSYFLIQ